MKLFSKTDWGWGCMSFEYSLAEVSTRDEQIKSIKETLMGDYRRQICRSKYGRGNECAKNKHIKPDRWRCQKDVNKYFSDFNAKLTI